MARRLPGGIRARLAIAIPAITLAVLAASFYALHQGTGADLQDRIDQELGEQLTEFQAEALTRVSRPDQLRAASSSYIASQAYHPEARIFVIEAPGGPPVTNERTVVEQEIEAESDRAGTDESGGEDPGALLRTSQGLQTITVPEAGHLRVLTEPIIVGGRPVGVFRVASPLKPVDDAQAGIRRTFLIVGLLALVASAGLAIWVSSLLTRPLRRMAETASAIDAGELTRRVEQSGDGEIRVLADAFNHMLDRLEDAFDRQRAFVSDASHELRNPLTVLRGQIELLERGAGSEAERRGTAEALIREIDRMNRLVDDMLMLAKAEGEALIEAQPIPLSEFLSDLERDLPLMGQRAFRVEGHPGGVLVADPDRLAQVIRNLVRNAVQHTEPDAAITVSVTPERGRVRFSVADTGPGVQPDQLGRLFDRFYRTDPGRAREQGGSGLGLAIAKAIVEAHGGRIWASSPPGEGVEVSFEIPGYEPA